MNEQISEKSFKRHVAAKFRVGQVLSGEAVYEGERMKCVKIDGQEIFRVNLIANIVDKFVQDGEKKYASLTLDDASGQIKAKLFGDDIDKLKELNQGDTLLVVGLLRGWNNEVYLTPEIMRKVDPRYLLIRKLEVEANAPKVLDKEKVAELKDKILSMVRDAESNGGIDVEKIILELKEPPEVINREIKKLLEDGIAYEPRPGKLRYLG